MKRGRFILGIFLVLGLVLLSYFVYANETNSHVGLEVNTPPEIFIESPENITYGFYMNEDSVISLNVTANFDVETWWYTLTDLTNEEVVNDSIVFEPGPGQSITAVQGFNNLEVFGNDSLGNVYSSDVNFTVETESSPVLGNISDPIYACENETLDYEFNATDIDSSTLDFSTSPALTFFIDPEYDREVSVVDNISISYLISPRLRKADTGNHSITLYVSDPTDLSDFRDTIVEVIPINNAPDVETIGVQTVYTEGDDSNFYEIVNVSDIEDGNQNSENISFDLTFYEGERLFNISTNGVIDYAGNEEDNGTYLIGLCVEDNGLSGSHPNISLCQGNSNTIEVCQNFSLTVTEENRPPQIIAHYPNNSEHITIEEGNVVYFNITKYDPDGTIPDSRWFLDNNLAEMDLQGNTTDEFYQGFGYSSAGEHFIIVNVTDGLVNTTMRWNITVLDAEPPEEPPSSGGGGGGGSAGIFENCTPKWVCGFWNTCQLVDIGLLKGEINKTQAQTLKKNCSAEGISNNSCGFHIRKCYDVNECNVPEGKPLIIETCEFYDNPSCEDGIKNCHHNSCEVLPDCGGPCPACPTCSDGIKNQGEKGIDCGGPCPWKCEVEEPLFKKINILYILIITLSLLVAAIIVRIIKILKEMAKEKNDEKI